MRTKTTLTLTLVVALMIAVTARGETSKPIPVLGFQPESSSTSYIGKNASVLSSVGVDGLLMTAPGKVSTVTAAERRQVAAAKASGLPSQMLISNYSNKTYGFSEQLAYSTLRSKTLTAQMASTLAADARKRRLERDHARP